MNTTISKDTRDKPVIELINVSKTFGEVKSLSQVDFKVYPSEIIQRIDTPDYKQTFSLILNLTRQGVSLIGYEQPLNPAIENTRQVVA